ncbi:MAG TPA: trehalose-phosphatase, partial [Candidatus Limnocylindrales bacterium]|nr:trehalose-phosphatase [Candidatus Limnocylindrales bacterium]
QAFRKVNQRFADAVADHHRPGDLIWVHDYQLALVPRLLRDRLPNATIGFFLHVPFPAPEILRVLPWRRELLDGILGASLAGFHTALDAEHFRGAAASMAGRQRDDERVLDNGRPVTVGAFPMGIDAAAFEAIAESPSAQAEVSRLRRSIGDRRLIVSVDRLDYTKGVPSRFLAFERLLERHPQLRDHIRLVQVGSPSRETVGPYRELRRMIEELAGRINGRFATVGDVPIHYVSRTLSRERLVALYRAADAALVTPLRDGMNLVSKEFVASRTDGDGVLILSEFAGAAAELDGAVLVNPYDIDGTADAIQRALEMPEMERRDRMERLRRRVLTHDVHRWAADFMASLERTAVDEPAGEAVSTGKAEAAREAQAPAAVQPPPGTKGGRAAGRSGRGRRHGDAEPATSGPSDSTRVWEATAREPSWGGAGASTADSGPEAILDEITKGGAPALSLILDYDGTLVPLQDWPDEAAPDPALFELLAALAARPHTYVHVVSGRTRGQLEAWLGEQPIGLHAEHGLWSRDPAEASWRCRLVDRPPWLDEARALLHAHAQIPGSLVEEKEASIAWHYRNVDREAVDLLLPRLRGRLERLAAREPLTMLEGDEVLEVRPSGIDKGLVVRALEGEHPAWRIAAIGDDTTDEDLFAAVRPTDVTVHVGPGASLAQFRVPDPAAVRALLWRLARSTPS